MSWTPYDYDHVFNNGPLDALTSKTLWQNMQHNAQNRLKRFSLTYYPTAARTLGAATTTPPDYDTVIEGLSGTLGGVANFPTSLVNPNTIGLQFSSPPTQPVCLPPISWPLSAQANKIRINMNLRVDQANVQVFAYARINDAYYPTDVGTVSLVTDGVMTYGPRITNSDSYAVVGTSLPTNSNSTYLQLEIDIAGAQAYQDLGVSDISIDPVIGAHCELLISFLSNQGDKVVITDQDFVGSLENAGSLVGTTTNFKDFMTLLTGQAGPNTWHAWMVFDPVPGLTGRAGQQSENKRQILQVRPSDYSDPDNSDTQMVIFPPILDIEPYASGSLFDYYECGKVTLLSCHVEEAFE